MKTFASTIAESVAEQANDIERLQNLVKYRLEGNHEAIQALGNGLSCSSPLSTSSSSMNINGVISKSMTCVMQVEGNKGSGTVQVDTYSGADNRIQIKTLVVRLFNGRVIKVGENERGQGKGANERNYIDAEFEDKK